MTIKQLPPWTPLARARLLGYRAFGILCRLTGIAGRMREIARRAPAALGGPCPQCAKRGTFGDHPVCSMAIEFSVLTVERAATLADYGEELGVAEDGTHPMAWAVEHEDRWYTNHPETVSGYFLEPRKDRDDRREIQPLAEGHRAHNPTRRD